MARARSGSAGEVLPPLLGVAKSSSGGMGFKRPSAPCNERDHRMMSLKPFSDSWCVVFNDITLDVDGECSARIVQTYFVMDAAATYFERFIGKAGQLMSIDHASINRT